MKILITGVTGTLGSALVKKILNETDHSIIGISRDEQKQRLLPRHDRLKLRIADVRDIDSLYRAIEDVQLIFHLAALKCVDTIEENPFESVKTNVLGTQNIVDIANQLGARVCFTSTDKAAHPINAYGQCKAVAEKLVMEGNSRNVVVRYGNVLGSRGSILTPLIKSLTTEGKAYVTHEEMTRFWMPIETVVGFVNEIAFSEIMTGLVTPKDIKAAYVVDLIKAVAKILRVYEYSTDIIGIRRGEKLHEVLLTEHETEDKKAITTADNPLRMTAQELQTMLKPIVQGMI
jgi:FlaA1/EpsC-like NDP-sugar epimerase